MKWRPSHVVLLLIMSAFPQNLGIGFAQMVWLFSGYTGYNTLRVIGYPAYLTLRQQGRLERMRQARMLHDGRHSDYFLYEARTQNSFPTMQSMGREIRPFFPYNLLDLISKKSADLLFGAEPSVRVEDQIQSKAIEDLAERTSLHRLLYHEAIEASCDGEAAVEAVIENGQTYLKRIDAADIFPQGPMQPEGQYKTYVRYNAKNLSGDEKSPEWALLVTTYEAGRITRKLQPLSNNGAIVPRQLTLNLWPQEDPESEPLEPETRTGIDRNTITWIPNQIVRDIAVSDYDGLVELQDLLNAKRTQIARVLAQHTDPNMAMPRMEAPPDGVLDSRYRTFFYDQPDMIPKYITWDPQLANAFVDFLEVKGALLLKSETSPILLGIKDHATAHVAYKSVRLEATNSLTKAQRKAVIWRAAIKRMLSVAQDLEQTIPGSVRYTQGTTGVEMQDGLPIDTDLQATEISTLRGAGVMSVDRALEILIPDPAARAKEAAALEAERQNNLPTVFGEPPPGGAAAQGGGISQEEGTPGGQSDATGQAAPTGVGIED